MKRSSLSMKPQRKEALNCIATYLIIIVAIWGNMTVPPVHAAGTVLIGQQQSTPTLDKNSGGDAEAFMVQAAVSGTIASLTVYIDATSKAKNLIVGLYSDK